jgi:hypothetical protein
MKKWTLILIFALVFSLQAASRFDFNLPSTQGTCVVETNDVQDAFKEGLRSFLNSDDNYQILLFPTLKEDLCKGKLSRVEINFRDGSIQGLTGLNVKRGRVIVEELEMDLQRLMSNGQLDVKKVGNVNFQFKLEEEDINSYLNKEEARLKLNQPRLEIEEGKITFSARVKTLFFSSKVRTEGYFEVNKEKQTVDFKARGLRLNSMGVPRFLLGNLVSRINPVLRLDGFELAKKLHIRLDDIKLENGYVELLGS